MRCGEVHIEMMEELHGHEFIDLFIDTSSLRHMHLQQGVMFSKIVLYTHFVQITSKEQVYFI